MKAKIRYGMFETNSSSCHAIQIKKSKYNYSGLFIDDNGFAHSSFGEFGWEFEEYCYPTSKLEYALTMVAMTEPFTTEEEFYQTKGFKEINTLLREKCHCLGLIIDNGFNDNAYSHDINGYIDHQSCCYSSLDDFLADYAISLERFIFDRNVVLKTGNDNC